MSLEERDSAVSDGALPRLEVWYPGGLKHSQDRKFGIFRSQDQRFGPRFFPKSLGLAPVFADFKNADLGFLQSLGTKPVDFGRDGGTKPKELPSRTLQV